MFPSPGQGGGQVLAGTRPASGSDGRLPADRFRQVTVDLCPKLFYSKSDFIDACIESSVSRYLEFQGLKSPLTVFADGQFTPIPTSKSEIFQNKEFTLPEKRLLMKFITSVSKSFAFQTPATLGRDGVMKEGGIDAKMKESTKSGLELEGSWA